MRRAAAVRFGAEAFGERLNPWLAGASTMSDILAESAHLESPKYVVRGGSCAIIRLTAVSPFDTGEQRSLLMVPFEHARFSTETTIRPAYTPFTVAGSGSELLGASITVPAWTPEPGVQPDPEYADDLGVFAPSHQRKIVAVSVRSFRTMDLPKWKPEIILGPPTPNDDEG